MCWNDTFIIYKNLYYCQQQYGNKSSYIGNQPLSIREDKFCSRIRHYYVPRTSQVTIPKSGTNSLSAGKTLLITHPILWFILNTIQSCAASAPQSRGSTQAERRSSHGPWKPARHYESFEQFKTFRALWQSFLVLMIPSRYLQGQLPANPS